MKDFLRQFIDPSGAETLMGYIVCIAGIVFTFVNPLQWSGGVAMIGAGAGLLTATSITGRPIGGQK